MKVKSTRSDVIVEMRNGGATLTLFARNTLVSCIILLAGAFISLGPLTILAYGLSVPNYGTALVMAALVSGIYWLTFRIGWKPKPFEIAFSRHFLEVGQQRFDYADIRSYGLAGNGGGAFDPATMPVPRNYTIGPHIYIELGPERLPITVGLKGAQAKEALRLFGQLFDAYRP